MNQKEMILKCKEYGYEVSPPLLYRQGKAYGFLFETNKTNKEKYSVDEKKFQEWLEQIKIPEDFICIRDVMKMYNVSQNALIYNLKKNGCEIKKMGTLRGGRYCARKADIERVISQYHQRIKK